MEKIKVFLSDPQVLFREGIHFILSGEEEFDVIGETTSNEEALAHIELNPPHIALLSAVNGKLSGPEVSRRIKRNLPSVAVILTMDQSGDDQLFTAMKSGASACFTKDTDPEDLLDTIREVSQGSQPIIEALLTPGLATRTLAEFEGLATLNEQLGHLLASLSGRETEILRSAAAGNSLDQIVVKLDINEDAIRRNLKMILNKMVTNDQARAVVEMTQRSLPSILSTAAMGSGPGGAEYVTREEFHEFKESLMERLKSFIGDLG